VFTLTEHTSQFDTIQKIEISDFGMMNSDQLNSLYLVVKLSCMQFGFEPDLNSNELINKIKSIVKKIVNGVICIIIDRSGLFLKDETSAKDYIDKNTLIGTNSGPILGLINNT